MIENRFSGLDFRKGLVKSGSKNTGGADPILKVNSTYNTFTLNPKALSLLGVAKGDFVVLYDMWDKGADDHYNNRFYISKGFEWNGVQQGAKIGDNGNFSYNKVWGAFMAEDLEIDEITGDQLVARELAIPREIVLKNGGVQKGYIALKKATGTLEQVGETTVEVVDGVEVELFAVTKIQFVEHDPKIADDDAVTE